MGTSCCILWLLMLTTTAQAYKSCSEIQGKNESAPHKIELGGVEYNVLCNMSAQPPETIIKVLNGDDVKITEPEKYSKRFSFIRDIQYSELPIKAIKELVELSENCRQFVSYHCKNASLFGNLSSLQSCWSSFNGDCKFYWGGCDGFKQNCKCDSGTSKDDTDQGLLTKKKDLPVVHVRVGGLKTNSNVSFTIGDLICYGDNQKGALTLQDRNSFVSMKLSSIDQEIKFKFKSSAPNTNKIIATVQMKNNKYVKVGLNSKNQLEVSHTFGGDVKQQLMEVDEEWHGVTLKIAQNSVYVRFDDGKLATVIENRVNSSVEKLAFGELAQTCESFIGCVKDLLINDIDYTKQLHDSSAKENVTNGCEQVKTFVCTTPTKTGGGSGDGDNGGKNDSSTKPDGGKSTAKPHDDGDDDDGGGDGDNTAIIVIVVIFILLLILLLVAFFITWYLKRNKGVYQTHEGSAEDIHGDTDNLTLVTKPSEQDPEGEKSKEYYL